MFVAGDFTRLAPPTGGFAVLKDGAAEPVPRVDEAVRSVRPDGSGGWVLFAQSELGDRTLIHVLADGSIGLRVSLGRRIESWLPWPVVSRGRAILVRQRAMFHYEAYAIDLATGAETGWVSPASYGPLSIVANDDVVVARTTDGSAQTLVGLDAVSGAVLWSRPGLDGAAMALGGGRVYVSVYNENGVPSGPTVALDAATGADVSWTTDPTCSGPIVASGELVVVNPDYRFTPDPRVALIDPVTGACTRVGEPDDHWTAIAVEGPTAYLAGDQRVVAVDRTGALRELGPAPNGAIAALAVAGGRVAIAGPFSGLGGVARAGLAAIDTSAGEPTAWDPRPDGPVRALGRAGSTLYVGGSFTRIAGRVRSGLAALDVRTGTALRWRPRLDGAVTGLLVDRGRLYVAGEFTHVGAAARRHLAAFDLASGALLDWAPAVRGEAGVHDLGLAAAPGGILVHGEFDRLDGRKRPGVALVSRLGALSRWRPRWPVLERRIVSAIATRGRIGLTWAAFGEYVRAGAFDARSGDLLVRWPGADAGQTLVQGEEALYVGGRAFETRSGDAWEAGLVRLGDDGFGYQRAGAAVSAADRRLLYLGGSFSRAGGLPQANLAIFPALPGTRP
ncbi:MAG: hypothetical protein R3C15_23095 [Thermoleophilia bacterium]